MRRHKAVRRKVIPDLKYGSIIVSQLINIVLKKGKLAVAQKIVYGMLDGIVEKKKSDSIEIFAKAIENVSPKIEVRNRRVGGATYQVPIEVSDDRQILLALRWIFIGAKNRKGISMKDSLVQEILDAYDNTGYAIKKKNDTHKMAQANRAFARFNW